jgi:hypothetical protein
MAIKKAKDNVFLEKLPDATRTRFQFIYDKDVEWLVRQYRDSISVLSKKNITIHLVNQEKLSKLSVNFALRSKPREQGATYSQWTTMFFDDADIFNGMSTASETARAFFDPTIYESENEALGYMFRFIAKEATGLKDIDSIRASSVASPLVNDGLPLLSTRTSA